MRGAKSFLCLVGILLLSTKSCNGLCKLENGTMARCHYLEDAKYIDTYHLEILKTSVSEDHLRGEIFHRLASLRNLDLSHGQIKHVEPDTFRELLDLRSLDLSHNKISNLPSTLFDGLKKLRNLNVRGNALVGIPDAVLGVKSLKSLDLAGNPLSCNCATLKARDVLLARRIHLSKRILCSSPAILKGKQLLEPDVQVICMFEEQDKEMQMDQPDIEGSGEANPDDPFDDPTPDEFDEDEREEEYKVPVTLAHEEIETPAPEKSSRVEESTLSEAKSDAETATIPSVTKVPLENSTNSDEMFFSEENDKRHSTSTVTGTKSTEEIDEIPVETETKSLVGLSEDKNEHPRPVEGSGEEEEPQEGSGIEGSGAGVPPINWDVPDDETGQETSSSEPAKTTDAGLLDMIWGVLWSTSAAPEEDKKKELGPEDEEFINVSSESTPITTEKTPLEQEIIIKSVESGSEGSLAKSTNEDKHRESDFVVGRVLDDSKSGKVKLEDSSNAEATDASATRQPKKGMGSYVVLAALLAVLGVLIGFAAYKGDFCRKKRKRNDPERGGTELKDMTKSLLDSGNANQPKISSNGNLENVPLVSKPPEDDSKIKENNSSAESPDVARTRYSAIPDVIDPIKPPRKSYAPTHDESERVIENGRSQQDLTKSSIPSTEITEPVCLRDKAHGEKAINGKNHHDSVSSLGTESRDSPLVRTSRRISSPTNGSHGTPQGYPLPPLSPGAQRVKITLQENPDSVPKTPILITRTKAGENLVKTP